MKIGPGKRHRAQAILNSIQPQFDRYACFQFLYNALEETENECGTLAYLQNNGQMAQDTFRFDPVAFALKEGERPDCVGLVLVVGWSWGSDISTGYEQLAKDIHALGTESLLVYDKQHLHCTVATLSSFKNTGSILSHASAKDREVIIEAWSQALRTAFERTDTIQPFQIVFRSLETSPAATFLQGDDSSGTMEALRAAVRRAAEDTALRKLSDELENKYSSAAGLCSLRDAIHVPDIIHSTVMRVASEVENTQSLAAGLAEISGRWKPATVKVVEISLVHEKHPYMHLDRVEGEVQSFSLPFR